ncbi:MAG: hypothetical protein HDQ88_04580 [Clostridia bacterium]|nr:hypothetical protein [Clostridia bacterium]
MAKGYEIYSIFNRKQKKGQTFERPIIKIKGQEIDFYKMIQENNVDTNIYDIIEKYDGKIAEAEKENTNLIFADIREIQQTDRLDKFNKDLEIKELYDRLPISIKETMGYDINKLDEAINKWAQQGVVDNADTKATTGGQTGLNTTGNDTLNKNTSNTTQD